MFLFFSSDNTKIRPSAAKLLAEYKVRFVVMSLFNQFVEICHDFIQTGQYGNDVE